MSNVIQNGLFSKWKQVDWAQRLDHIKKLIENKNESNENLSLNQISLAFYILLFCLSFSLGIFLIEVVFFMHKWNIFRKHLNNKIIK